MAILTDELRAQRRAAAPAYTPSETERDALSTLNDRFRPNDPIRLHYEQAWLTNIAYLVGMQYLSWDPVQRQLIYTQTPSLRWRARSVHNLIRPYVELDIGTVGVFTPAFIVRPANGDPENFNRAEANRDIVDHYWRAQDMDEKKYDLLYWLKVTGNAFIYTGWDKCAGEAYLNHEPMMLRGQQVNTASLDFDGDIYTAIESPFTVYWDIATQKMEDLQWFISARARPRAWVEQHFPDRAPYVPIGLQQDNLINRQRWVLDLAGAAALYGGGQPNDSKKDWCLVREMYEKPSLDFPRGRYMIDANGIMLEEPRDNPTPKAKLPFIWCRDMLVPGRLPGQCNVDNLISMQRSYNRMVSKKEEHIVITANAKILEHATNELPQTSWQTEVGEVIKWHGLTAPAYLVPPPMPPETDTELNRLKQDFDLVTSQYGPARGQYPGKISGKAINYLVEQNAQNKTPMVDRLSKALAAWATNVLELAQEFVLEPRLIKVMGRGKQWNVRDFQSQDIGGNTEVFIEIDSMIPKSQTMALDRIMQMIQGGLMNPMNAEDRARAYKALAMEDSAPLVEDASLDLRVARNENKMAMMGIPPPRPNFLENQDIHMLLHAEQTKTDEFRTAGPLAQQLLMAHINAHMKIAQPQAGVTVPPPEESAIEPATQIGGGGGGAPMPNFGGQQQAMPMQAFT